MKIILVTPLLDVGGGQRYIVTLANHWAKSGHEVIIVALREKEIFYEISEGVQIVQFTFGYKWKMKKFLAGVKTGWALRKIIKENQPDFVLSILSSTNILTILSTMFLKTKVFVRDAFSPTRETGWIKYYSRKYLYRFATGVIAQTKEIKEFTEKETGNHNVKVIFNPVVRGPFIDNSKREKIILNVGALTSRKGQKYIIKACQKINNPDWKFVILGEGEDRGHLEKMIRDLKVEDKVTLLGSVKNVEEWLARSSIFVFPSNLEGLPNALIEALAAGVPCISFDCETGPRDLIKNGQNGFLVPVGDEELFTEKIKELIEDTGLRDKFSKNGYQSTAKLNVEEISDEVLNFCTKL